MQNSELKKLKLKIDGMHCTSCAINIDMDLEDLEGVKSASTSYAREVCEVEFDESKLGISNIIESIKNSGYNVSE